MYSENDKSFHADYFESVFKYGNILNKGSYERQCRDYEMVYGDVLPDDKNAKVLDVGCGIGHFLYYLKKRGYKNFCGIDISPQQVNFCKENISERVEVADAFDFLKVGREKYSVIVAHDVLEHIRKEKTLTLLRLIYDSLENGGILILRVPNMSNPFSLDSRYRDFTHETGFTEKNLYQILWIAGFRNIQISSTKIIIRSFRNRVRSLLVDLLHSWIRFLYYIQDFSVPNNLGKNLIAICRK